MNEAVILYGPPASGKNTVSEELTRLDPAFAMFQRLKAGPGRTNGYRITTPAHVAALAARGDVLYLNERYGATYVFDTPHLLTMLGDGHIPILHVGQGVGIRAILEYPARWTLALLWCERPTSKARSLQRGDVDTDERLKAWDETVVDLLGHSDLPWSVVISTETTSPPETASLINDAVRHPTSPVQLDVSRLGVRSNG